MVALLLAAAMVLSMVGCGNGDSDKDASKNEGGEKTLTFLTYWCGENVGGVYFEPAVERFNEKYEGQYELIIEEVVEQSYNDKVTQLAQSGEVPALLATPSTEVIEEILIPGGFAKDMTDFIEAHPEISALFLDGAVEACTQDDGTIISLPSTNTRNTGCFWNSSMVSFDKAVCEMTVDEFIAALGDQKVALQTVDNAWTSLLLLTAFIANEEGGAEWLKTNYKADATDFNVPAILNAVTKLKALYDTNGAANSVGAAYADAANAFFNKQAAFIANGPWMNSDFKAETGSGNWGEGFDGADVVADFFPGNVAINGQPGYGRYMLTTGGTEDEQEVAEAFLAFVSSQEELEQFCLCEGTTLPKAELSQDFLDAAAEDPLFSQQIAKTTDATVVVPNFADCMISSIASQVFGVTLTQLYNGDITPQEFCDIMSQKSAEAAQ